MVIPAFNEESVIRRCLEPLVNLLDEGSEIVVACNGCSDETASIVRNEFPQVKLVELEAASKTGALNAGDRATSIFPRMYLDADVTVDADSLRALAVALGDSKGLCGSLPPRFELEGCSRVVKSFYRIWQMMPYLKDSMVGSGLYGLSRDGRERFGEFPGITADDQFVMQLFSGDERVVIAGSSFTIFPPKTLRGLFRVRTRVYRGNLELASRGYSGMGETGGGTKALLRLASRPETLVDAITYLGINVAAKLVANYKIGESGWSRAIHSILSALGRDKAPGSRPLWERDETSRGG